MHLSTKISGRLKSLSEGQEMSKKTDRETEMQKGGSNDTSNKIVYMHPSQYSNINLNRMLCAKKET